MRSTRLRFGCGVALLTLAACGRVPESTEKARGILEGPNVVLALSVLFVVLAVGLLVSVLAVDRFVRNRRALAEAPPPEEPEEEADEVVAGITVGRAPVPRWLYGAYVLIPVFAFAYVFSNIAPPPAAEEAEETAAPTGPCTECEIAAAQIKFDTDELVVAAGEEITVAFNNNDTGVPHDFSVWKDEASAGAGDPVATTGQFSGGSRETSFNAGEVTYFNCTVHPTSMFGTITAEG